MMCSVMMLNRKLRSWASASAPNAAVHVLVCGKTETTPCIALFMCTHKRVQTKMFAEVFQWIWWEKNHHGLCICDRTMFWGCTDTRWGSCPSHCRGVHGWLWLLSGMPVVCSLEIINSVPSCFLFSQRTKMCFFSMCLTQVCTKRLRFTLCNIPLLLCWHLIFLISWCSQESSDCVEDNLNTLNWHLYKICWNYRNKSPGQHFIGILSDH